jgi:hypothetical protein
VPFLEILLTVTFLITFNVVVTSHWKFSSDSGWNNFKEIFSLVSETLKLYTAVPPLGLLLFATRKNHSQKCCVGRRVAMMQNPQPKIWSFWTNMLL